MHDPLYRTSIAWQNVGYNQPAHTGFYLGVGMSTPAVPNIYLANNTLSIEDSGTKNSSSIKIYPNPTTGKLYISGVYSGTIEVYDSMGKSLIKKSSNTINSVDLSTYPKGLYLVKITQETGVTVFKTILK